MLNDLYLISLFSSFRFWFRLYWFPLKVLYATCVSSLQSVPSIPFYFFFNALLLALLLMNIYWFLVRKQQTPITVENKMSEKSPSPKLPPSGQRLGLIFMTFCPNDCNKTYNAYMVELKSKRTFFVLFWILIYILLFLFLVHRDFCCENPKDEGSEWRQGVRGGGQGSSRPTQRGGARGWWCWTSQLCPGVSWFSLRRETARPGVHIGRSLLNADLFLLAATWARSQAV